MTTKYQPGHGKVAGSGVLVGTKQKRTLAKERDHDEAKTEARLKAALYKGLSMEEMLDREDFDPRVYAVAMIRAEHTNEGVKAKLLQMMMDKLYPSLKSVESKIDQVTRIEITGLPMPPEFVEMGAVVNPALTSAFVKTTLETASVDPALSRPHVNDD